MMAEKKRAKIPSDGDVRNGKITKKSKPTDSGAMRKASTDRIRIGVAMAQF